MGCAGCVASSQVCATWQRTFVPVIAVTPIAHCRLSIATLCRSHLCSSFSSTRSSGPRWVPPGLLGLMSHGPAITRPLSMCTPSIPTHILELLHLACGLCRACLNVSPLPPFPLPPFPLPPPPHVHPLLVLLSFISFAVLTMTVSMGILIGDGSVATSQVCERKCGDAVSFHQGLVFIKLTVPLTCSTVLCPPHAPCCTRSQRPTPSAPSSSPSMRLSSPLWSSSHTSEEEYSWEDGGRPGGPDGRLLGL